MPDHIHILFDAKNLNLAEFVNAFKSASSRNIKKQFSEELKPYYWKPYFWSLSYFIGTVSDRISTAVKEYIKNQKNEQSKILKSLRIHPRLIQLVRRGTLRF